MVIKINDNIKININKWKININKINNNKEYISNKIKVDDILNGKFSYYYKYCIHNNEINNGKIIYSNGKNISNKIYFKNLIISKYIPKININNLCKCNKDNIYYISYCYK
jgi:hypothetical protein